MTIEQAMSQAVALYQAGRLGDAEAMCRQILAVAPKQAEALHLLGVIAHSVGRSDLAVQLIGQAAALNPACAEYHSNLGEAYRLIGRVDEAIAACRTAIELAADDERARLNLGAALYDHGNFGEAIAVCRAAIKLNPDLAEAHNLLGMARDEQNELVQAIEAFQRAIKLKPDFAQAYNNLGVALKRDHRLDEAIAAFHQAVGLATDYAGAHSNLGSALLDRGKVDEAISACRHAIRLRPDFAEAHNNLGFALRDAGQLEEAEMACRAAIRLKPHYVAALINLGNLLRDMARLDEAAQSYDAVMAINPNNADAYSNLGVVLKEQGKVEEAITTGRKAIELNPQSASAHSNLLFALYFVPGLALKEVLREHREWDRRHAQPLKHLIKPHRNDRSPDRKLRIGYVSADLRNHPVGKFLWPLLAEHDREGFEIVAYSQTVREDEMTEKLRGHTSLWRRIAGMSDEQVAEQIREDRIDILVDLALHTAGNRLLVFAHKPAPVQVSYLGYAGTTGMEAMDYRLTDPHLDPPGTNDEFYTEKSVRLSETYWCYTPWCSEVEVAELPALKNKFITFGSLNNFSKMSRASLKVWARLLQEVAESRLRLHAPEGSHRQWVGELFEKEGVDSGRLSFVARVPPADYYRQYNEIDIALDSFPYSGGTTNCDALWMGAPVVSLIGRLATGRGGFSLLSNLALSELAARSKEEYLRIAKTLAGDLEKLATLRSTLRGRMENSPIMDGKRFARQVEQVYRQMWATWCAAFDGGIPIGDVGRTP